MKKLSLILFNIFILLSIQNLSIAEEKTISGKAYVVDGDTIKIKGKSIRLFGIDAPEMKQICFHEDDMPYYCGAHAKYFLKLLIDERDAFGPKGFVTCKYKNLDRYGRIIGDCDDLNLSMVIRGHAVAYTRYSNIFLNAQEIAREKKRGIWSGKFDIPEQWRKKNKWTII